MSSAHATLASCVRRQRASQSARAYNFVRGVAEDAHIRSCHCSAYAVICLCNRRHLYLRGDIVRVTVDWLIGEDGPWITGATTVDAVEIAFTVNGIHVHKTGPLGVVRGTELHPCVSLGGIVPTGGIVACGRFTGASLITIGKRTQLLSRQRGDTIGQPNVEVVRVEFSTVSLRWRLTPAGAEAPLRL